LIRKQKKLGGFRVTKAIGRETLMKSLKKKFPSPGVLSQTLDNTKIFFFPFTQMLQDLLDTMQGDVHVINAPPPPNSNHFVHHEEIGDELWDTHRRHGQGAFFFTFTWSLDFENYCHYLVFGSLNINWVISQIMKGMSNYQDAVQIKCNRCTFSCYRKNYTDNFTYVKYV